MSTAIAQQFVDQRATPRFDIEAQISMESQTNFYTGFSENVGEGGVFVAMHAPPAVGEVVRLRVHLQGGREVMAAGQVRWHRLDERGEPCGAGIQFMALDKQSTAMLQWMMGRAGQAPLLVE